MYDDPAVTRAGAVGGGEPAAPAVEAAPGVEEVPRRAVCTPHPVVAELLRAAQALPAVVDEAEQWAAVDSLLAVMDVISRATGAAARLLSQVEGDGLWALTGGRSVTDWLAVSAGLPHHKAKELVQLSRALRDHLPATAQAVVVGEVAVAQAHTLARYAVDTPARAAALAGPAEECGEAFLLERARRLVPDSYRNLVRRWAAAADPAADERGYKEACDREYVALSPTSGGFHLAGFLATEHGAVVGTMLDAMMTPPAKDGPRTTQQRRATALVESARLVLDHGLAGSGASVRPHVNVVVDYDTFTRAVTGAGVGFGISEKPADDPDCTVGTIAGAGSALFRLEPVMDVERFAVGEVLGAGPVPSSVLARLACDSEVSRVVFGPDSQVINVGRAERTFSGPRRRAIIARDQTCRYPGCNAPPALGELHHIDWWARDGGDTDINTGILLCWYHHDLVHTLHVQIRRSPTGSWVFTTRYGGPITA